MTASPPLTGEGEEEGKEEEEEEGGGGAELGKGFSTPYPPHPPIPSTLVSHPSSVASDIALFCTTTLAISGFGEKSEVEIEIERERERERE